MVAVALSPTVSFLYSKVLQAAQAFQMICVLFSVLVFCHVVASFGPDSDSLSSKNNEKCAFVMSADSVPVC